MNYNQPLLLIFVSCPISILLSSWELLGQQQNIFQFATLLASSSMSLFPLGTHKWICCIHLLSHPSHQQSERNFCVGQQSFQFPKAQQAGQVLESIHFC